jgi:hypothetical protein
MISSWDDLRHCSGHHQPDGLRPADAAQPWITLFDGALGPDWKMSTIRNQPGHDDPGRFELVDGALEARPGTDIGLLWYTKPGRVSFRGVRLRAL